MKYRGVICDRCIAEQDLFLEEVKVVRRVSLTAARRELEKAVRRGLRLHGGFPVYENWGATVKVIGDHKPSRRVVNIYVDR